MLLRAIYKNDAGKKVVCGWAIDKKQAPGTAHLKVPGTYFSEIVLEEPLIPKGDGLYIEGDMLCISDPSKPSSIQTIPHLSLMKERKISELKSSFSSYILSHYSTPTQISISNLVSMFPGATGAEATESWILQKLTYLSKLISKVKKANTLEEMNVDTSDLISDSPPDFSLMKAMDDLVGINPCKRSAVRQIILDKPTSSIPLDRTPVSVVHYNITNALLAREESLNNMDKTLTTIGTISGVFLSESGAEGLPVGDMTGKNFRVPPGYDQLKVNFSEATKVHSFTLKSTGNGQITCNAIDWKVIDESTYVNEIVQNMIFTFLGNTSSVGPLQVTGVEESVAAGSPIDRLSIEPSETVTMVVPEGVNLSVIENGALKIPDGSGGLRPSSTPLTGDGITEIKFTAEVACTLECRFAPSTYIQAVPITITEEKPTKIGQSLSVWTWSDGTLLLPEEYEGELLVSVV